MCQTTLKWTESCARRDSISSTSARKSKRLDVMCFSFRNLYLGVCVCVCVCVCVEGGGREGDGEGEEEREGFVWVHMCVLV